MVVIEFQYVLYHVEVMVSDVELVVGCSLDHIVVDFLAIEN